MRRKAQQEAQKAKLEALEKKLGINQDGAGSSSPDPLAGKKHRLDDTEYLEQSREIVDNVKSAVTAGMSTTSTFHFCGTGIDPMSSQLC